MDAKRILIDSPSLYIDAQMTSTLLQCHNRTQEPDRHTNAASINTVKWEPPPIREPRWFLIPFPLYLYEYLYK